MVGVPRVVVDEVAARVEKQYSLKRPQFLINTSHTHTGPVVWQNIPNLTVFPPTEQEKLLAYQRRSMVLNGYQSSDTFFVRLFHFKHKKAAAPFRITG